MILLSPNETIEDLQYKGLRMIQRIDGFRFGEDSVLLSNFVAQVLSKSINSKKKILDLGCNCGSISLLLSAKLVNSSITGVEITKNAADTFNKNIILNKLSDKVSCVNKNWNDLLDEFSSDHFDCIVSNPPYAVMNSNSNREITDIRIAREEIASSMDELMSVASRLLKHNGKIFFIYRANRLVDVIDKMRKYRLEPRILRAIQPFTNKPPTSFVIMGQKNGKPGGFVYDKPIIVFEKEGIYTQEVIDMYGKYPPMSVEELHDGIIFS